MDQPTDLSLTALLTVLGMVGGMMAKFLLDKRKMNVDEWTQIVAGLRERIVQLEKEVADCKDRDSVSQRRIGYLEGIVERITGEGCKHE